MAEITLVTATDPHRLLEAAADGFLSPIRASPDNPFPTPPYLLALRQGGIREDLFQLAAEQGVPGWFDPPICIFNELPTWLGIPERSPLDDFERVTLLGEVLRGVDGEVFHAKKSVDRFVDAVDRLFGELTAEGVTPERLSEAFAAVPDRDHFETDRDRELVTAYRTYLDRLRDAGRRDGRDTWPACADVVRRDPDAFAERLGGRREIRLFGLNDLRGGWRILLKALAESPALDSIAIYTGPDVALEIEGFYTRASLDEPVSMAAQLFGEPVADPAHRFDCLRPPDTDTEVEWVAARVRRLADDGVPLHRIAIVSRQARPYARHVLRALERAGVPATARERAALEEIPVVRAVLSVVAAAAEGWTRHALAELAGQPYLQLPLAPRVINYLGFQRRIEGLKAWDAALEKQERASVEFFAADEAGEEERHRGPRPPRPERVKRTREALALLADRLEVPSGNQPLESWVAWLDGFLTDDPLGIKDSVYRVPENRFDLARWDLSAWRGVRRIVSQWHAALKEWGGREQPMSAATFHEVLRETLSGDAPVWTTVQRGVRVLEGMAAAYRHFDHLFLVGMQAGSFPVRQPRPTVLGEREREAMRAAGLPLDRAADRDHRERELFRVLVAGAGALTVSYPSIDQAGRDVLRSVFLDELADVAVPKHVDPKSLLSLPVADSDAAHDQARHAFDVERLRKAGQLSPYNGAIERKDLLERLASRFGDEYVWSPTQLETYAKCPWGFFSTRILRLDREEDPDHDIDALTRGIVLHDVLRRFYDRARERVDGPVYLLPQDESWALPMLHDALDEALTHAEGTAWLGHPTLRHATREDMRRVLETFLRAECQEHEDQHSTRKRNAPRMVRTGVTENELAFQDAVLERKGITLRYRGVIDRVECGIDERVDTGHLLAAVDYKSSTYSAPGGGDSAAWDDGVVLQIPLYAHALKGCYEGKEVARVEYWGLKQGEAVHRLELYQVDKKTGELLKNSEAHDKMNRALDAAVDHVRNVRAGKFPAELPPSSNCSPFCHFVDICRVADGPQVNKWGRR